MDLNFARAKREKAIALEVARDCYVELQPIFDATVVEGVATADRALMGEEAKVAHIFGLVCQRRSLDAAAAKRVWSYLPRELVRIGRERRRALKSLASSAHEAAVTAERAERRLRRATDPNQ